MIADSTPVEEEEKEIIEEPKEQPKAEPVKTEDPDEGWVKADMSSDEDKPTAKSALNLVSGLQNCEIHRFKDTPQDDQFKWMMQGEHLVIGFIVFSLFLLSTCCGCCE